MTEDTVNPETDNSHHFRNPSLEVTYRLIKEGVLKRTDKSNWRERSVDLDKAINILESTPEENLEVEEIELNKPEAEQALRKSVKALVDNGIISKEIAITAGKIIRPSNIRLTDDNSFSFYFEGDVFPDANGKRGEIEAGKDGFNFLMQDIRKKISKAEINLTEEQIREVALRGVFTHEYGHAVEKALIMQKAKRESEKVFNLISFEAISARTELDIHEEIFTEIAPRPELTNLFRLESGIYSNAWDTSTERISTGFEYLGIKYSLQDIGCPKDKIDKLMEIFSESDRDVFDDFKTLIQTAASGGVNLETLGGNFESLTESLKKQGKGQLAEKLPPRIDSTQAGYLLPLNESELKNVILTLSE